MTTVVLESAAVVITRTDGVKHSSTENICRRKVQILLWSSIIADNKNREKQAPNRCFTYYLVTYSLSLL